MNFLFKPKTKEEKINGVEVLYNNIRMIRLLSDIIIHLEETENKRPEFIDNNEGFFKANFKKIKNKFNSELYKNALENLELKIEKFNEISEEKISTCHLPKYLSDMIEDIKNRSIVISNEIFKEDSYKLGKIEFVMNMLCDNIVEFTNNEETSEIISKILGENDCFVEGIKDDLVEAYQRIGIKANDVFNKVEAPLFAGAAAILLSNPLISAGVLGVSIAEGIIQLCGVNYSLFDKIKSEAGNIVNDLQKERLLNAFYKLDVDQTAFSLAKSTVLLLQINKYRANDPVAQEIYESYVENYIDIKSDITLKMLLSEDINDNLQKTKVFNNVDIYLGSKLQNA